MTESSPYPESGGPDFAEIAERLRRDADVRVAERENRRKRRNKAIAAVAAVGTAAVIVTAIALSGGADDTGETGAIDSTVAASSEESVASEPGTSDGGATAATDEATDSSAGPTSAPTTAATAVSTSANAATSTTVPSTTSAAATSTTAPATTTTAPVPTSVASEIDANASELPVRYAVFEGGKLYLRGSVPDQATADQIASRAGSVIGAANVFVEYKIDPGAPLPNNAPVFVADKILFAPGSADVRGEFTGLLDIGVALLAQYPKVHIDVEGHTDDRGTDEYNLELSQKRIDAILRYLDDKGADLSRVKGIARGESDPIADNSSPLGQAANRRIEFTIFDLLA